MDCDYLIFGYGRLVCFGWFVVFLEMKMVFVVMLEWYEVSFYLSGKGGVRF